MNPRSEARLPNPRLTTQWSGRPTAQALYSYAALFLWAAAHRQRSAHNKLHWGIKPLVSGTSQEYAYPYAWR
jgi:hypothetical protein